MDHPAQGTTGGYSAKSPVGFSEWLAFGAIVVGTVGAIVGAARCLRSAGSRHFRGRHADSTTVTSPHGDKLSSILET